MYFIIGIDIDFEINELALLEFIHNMVETLDKYFENVCELDVSECDSAFLIGRASVRTQFYFAHCPSYLQTWSLLLHCFSRTVDLT